MPLPGQTVTITDPVEDDVLDSNPFKVRGTARTFENTVAVRILDANGILLRQTSATARGELGHFNPWEKEIFLTVMPASPITIEAVDYSAKDGSIVSRAFVHVTVGVEAKRLQLYFPNSSKGDPCTTVAEVDRNVPKSISAARLLVEALIAGPTAEEKKRGFSSPFPDGSDVDSVILRDGVMTVDLNERLQNVGGACRATSIRLAIEKTLGALDGVKRVEITAGGNLELALQP